MALLITFEGCEGCGKSTQVESLYARLRHKGLKVVIAREPGTTKLGDKIRALLKERKGVEISPLAELFLFLAARHQLVTEVLQPSQERKVILCDRYASSSLAYQGYGRGLDLSMIERLNTIATEGHVPDLVVLLDIPPEIGLGRKGKANSDHFEEEGLAFHQRVREGYLKMAQQDPGHWLVVDGTLPQEEAETIIWSRVKPLINMWLGSKE